MSFTIFAPVKINIALHVGAPRADGYHPVDTLCVFPAIGDVLAYDPGGAPGIDYAGRFGARLAEEPFSGNLIWRAFAALGVEPEGRFLLAKETPIASGIGAGTADGVAAMLLLNDALELGFGAHDLIQRALVLGADGPVCMAAQVQGGGLVRAEGIGERITPLGRIEAEAIVVANPGVPVSTGAVFRRFDSDEPGPLEPIWFRRGGGMTHLLNANGNDLQPMAEDFAPEIADLIMTMESQAGARAARMSGSGASCFALHASAASAERAARELKARGFWAESSFLLPG